MAMVDQTVKILKQFPKHFEQLLKNILGGDNFFWLFDLMIENSGLTIVGTESWQQKTFGHLIQ